MNASHTMEPVNADRIVGAATAVRAALLERIDRAVEQACADHVWDLAGWDVEAVLTATPTHRAGGFVVALRVTPMADTPHDVGVVPWDSIGQAARRIVEEVWEVTSVVPDVATDAPAVSERPARQGASPGARQRATSG